MLPTSAWPLSTTRIHELNRRYLNHDWPTDVLSFTLDDDDDGLAGEIIVSADTATVAAERYGWKMADEILLYVIHGGDCIWPVSMTPRPMPGGQCAAASSITWPAMASSRVTTTRTTAPQLAMQPQEARHDRRAH